MSIPFATLKTYEKNRVDLAIDEFAKLEKPTVADLNRVKTQASIQNGIDRYRIGAVGMSDKQLETERHSSKRMACYMTASTDARPSSYCDCHAIVSGKHESAAPMRAIMAWCLMRIDDPRNGCWLPRNWDARPHMPSWLKGAVPHQGLHNPEYYQWMATTINIRFIGGLDDLIVALKMIRTNLQGGSLRSDAWPKRKVV
ncbi:MAG: AHH domain-containing protein [Pseudomonadota bacterium]